MAMRLVSRGSFAVLSLAIGVSAWSAPAHSEQYLFDMLFGNNQKRERQAPPVRQRQREARTYQRQQTTQERRRVKVPEVSSPSYYDYQPETAVQVDFSKITDNHAKNGYDQASPFIESLPDLSDFELHAEKQIAAALVKHYSSNPDFIWVTGDEPNEKARAVLRVLAKAGDFGLSETDYVVNLPQDSSENPEAQDVRLLALMRFEMTLSARALRYARDANMGRINPNKLSGYHDFPEKPLEEGRVLQVLADTTNPAAYLKVLHPQNAMYAALTDELARLRKSPEKDILVAPDTFVRPGGRDPEFSKILRIIERDFDGELQAEHGEVIAKHIGSHTYARELVPVIKAAQKRHDLYPDGIVGPQTVDALAGDSKGKRIEKVLLALERLRWHPSHLGDTRVMINAAGYTVRYHENGQVKLSMRTVVGKRSNQTSFFHDKIEYVEFNPYWGVPRSIIINEMLPKLRRDPYYLDKAGYEVTDVRGRQISSAAVNWWAHGANIPYNVRQKPGRSNALGRLKIMFPNKHAIYMHDTPQKSLFERDTRAFSHGCVRLQEPRLMAAAVLGTSNDEIDRMISTGRNMRREMKENIPVYVGYFTAWPDASGKVVYHRDVYERDKHLKSALSKVEEVRSPGS